MVSVVPDLDARWKFEVSFTPEEGIWQLVNRRLCESRIVNRRLCESRIVNRRFCESRIVNRRLCESRIVNRRLCESRVVNRRDYESRIVNRRLCESRITGPVWMFKKKSACLCCKSNHAGAGHGITANDFLLFFCLFRVLWCCLYIPVTPCSSDWDLVRWL